MPPKNATKNGKSKMKSSEKQLRSKTPESTKKKRSKSKSPDKKVSRARPGKTKSPAPTASDLNDPSTATPKQTPKKKKSTKTNTNTKTKTKGKKNTKSQTKTKTKKKKKNKDSDKQIADAPPLIETSSTTTSVLPVLPGADKQLLEETGKTNNFPIAHPVGTRVKALYSGDGQWYDGTVQGVTGENTPEVQHYVLFDGFDNPEPVSELTTLSLMDSKEQDQEQEDEDKDEQVKQQAQGIPVPKVSPGERLGHFGLQELAAAGIDAIQRKDYLRIREYLKMASCAENGADAAIIATGDTPLHVALRTGNMRIFKIFLQCKTMAINFEKENRVGLTPSHEMLLKGHIKFVHVLLRQKYANIKWDVAIGAQTCHGIDENSGQRCRFKAKDEGFCHEVAAHVREMVKLQRDRSRAIQEGKEPLTEEEIETLELETKVNGLRGCSSTTSELCERAGHIGIAEIVDGFRNGSNYSVLAALNQLQDVCKGAAAVADDESLDQIRRQLIQALGALEGVLLRGTWRNHAPPDIEENLRHWRRLFLMDSRFRVKHSRTPRGVNGLETEISGQLTDLLANVRLSLPEGTWNMHVQKAWLRILNIASDVYNVCGKDGVDSDDEIPAENESAFYIPKTSMDEKIEYLSDAFGAYTRPHF